MMPALWPKPNQPAPHIRSRFGKRAAWWDALNGLLRIARCRDERLSKPGDVFDLLAKTTASPLADEAGYLSQFVDATHPLRMKRELDCPTGTSFFSSWTIGLKSPIKSM